MAKGGPRSQTLPVPRCPFCENILEEAQLYFDAELMQWQELWGCDSCHTNHIFPARIEYMELVKDSLLLPRHHKALYLPK